MIVKTRVFELCDGRYHNLSELAGAMGISVSQVSGCVKVSAASTKNSSSGR